jgi:hypothetical protein
VNEKEHKDARSLSRLVDMEVSRKKDLGFLGEASRERGALLNSKRLP